MSIPVRRIVGLGTAVVLALGLTAGPAAARPERLPDQASDRARAATGTGGDGPVEDETPQPRVVVAAIDSAINPYHEFFHQGGDGPYEEAPAAVTQDVLDEFGIGADQIISLTRTGDQDADLAADEAQWDAVERGVPYWFAGTNVIGISFDDSGLPPLKPDEDKSPHGVGVSASVLEANPAAVVVLVEGITTASEEWAFTHPSVDIVTTSYGPVGSLPFPWHLEFSYTGVVENGKLHFGAVDNTPALSWVDTTGGPWWSIGVAGFQEEGNRGRQHLSGTASDFVGNFTQVLPYCMDCQEGRSEVAGTSFATPRSAGTTSAAVLAARDAAGHEGGIVGGEDGPAMVKGGDATVTNWQVRRALEESAAYPGTSEYDPAADGHPLDMAASPVLDPAPWATVGWGLITPDPEHGVVPEMLAHLGVEGEPTRHKGADACAFMTAQYEFRYQYWNNYAFMGESFGTTEDPYIRC